LIEMMDQQQQWIAESGSRGFLTPSPCTTPDKSGFSKGMRVRTERFTKIPGRSREYDLNSSLKS